MDASELDLVRTSVRHLVETTDAANLAATLAEQGFDELLVSDPAAVLTALATEVGAARAPAPVLDLAVGWGAGLGLDPGRIVVPVPGAPSSATPGPAAASRDGDALVVDGVVVAGDGRGGPWIVGTGDGAVSLPADALGLEPIGGFDPTARIARVRGRCARADATTVADSSAWVSGIAAGRRVLGSQMVGAADRMLADTVAYVIERRQYGQPIGGFQAVKHKLADVRTAATAADAAVAAAWTAGPDDAAVLSMAAKALAGRAQQVASAHCHQVHGGIAFTVEHGFQTWMRRGHLLDALCGSARELTRSVGHAVLARGEVPRHPPMPS